MDLYNCTKKLSGNHYVHIPSISGVNITTMSPIKTNIAQLGLFFHYQKTKYILKIKRHELKRMYQISLFVEK